MLQHLLPNPNVLVVICKVMQAVKLQRQNPPVPSSMRQLMEVYNGHKIVVVVLLLNSREDFFCCLLVMQFRAFLQTGLHTL